MVLKNTLALAGAFSIGCLITSPLFAAPNGNYNLEIKTKNPWPITASVSGDTLTLKSKGRTTIHGATKTTSASGTKISGKANFSTKSCTDQSQVKVTLVFTKDGKFKSGSASGRCNRSSGSVSFRGAVAKK